MAITLTKEDGTGLANANAYEDVAGANQYMEDTGRRTEWTAFSSAERRSALIVATQFMDQTYRCRWLGVPQESTQDTQALDWPREGLFLPSGAVRPASPIPDAILQGCAEYALIAASDAGINPDPTYDASGRALSYDRKRVEGAVEIEKHFTGGTTPVINRTYPKAEAVLREFLTPSSRTLLRA